MKISAERINEVLSYNRETGIFVWLRRPETNWHQKTWNSRYSGKQAGNLDANGYLTLTIDGATYKAHRIAFFLEHAMWPPEVDHKNGKRSDNRGDNLRAADDKTNAMNAAKRSDNKSGWKGVSWHKGVKKWAAQINIDGKRKSIGYFLDAREAAEEYMFAALKHHGEFARLE